MSDFNVSRPVNAQGISANRKQLNLEAKKLTQFVVSQKITQEDSEAWTELDAFNPLAMTRRFEKLEKRTKRRVSGSEDKESSGAGESGERIEKVKDIDQMADFFQKRNRELKSQLLLDLKARIKEGDTPEEILKKTLEIFPDPSLADEALEFLMATLDGDTSSAATLRAVIQARKNLNNQQAREVKAGRNIQGAAHEYGDKSIGTPTQLRNIYRDITGNPREPYLLFQEFAAKYDYEQIKALIAFLLHSIGSDLNSKGPSIVRAELVRLFTEARTLQSVLGVYRFFEGRMPMIVRLFKEQGATPNMLLSFEFLAKAFMTLVQDRYPNADRVLKLADMLGLEEEVVSQIIIYSQFRDATKGVSPRLYRDIQHRFDLYAAIVDALEELEDTLEEEEEEAEEH